MNSDEKPLDPDKKYDHEWLRAVDSVALVVHKIFPDASIQRTRDVYRFTIDDPEGVIVLVTPDEVDIRLPTIEWTRGYAGPVPSSRRWRGLPLGCFETLKGNYLN
jgi:hypothetical protein